jgi:tetratricopeptide (TPR) repeat protein
MKKIISFIISSIILLSCRQQPVTNPKDYAIYLQEQPNTHLQHINDELNFWTNRLSNTPGDIISESKIAGLLTKRFSYSGNIKEVHEADSLYRLVNIVNHINSSGTYRSLAANCITQHRFLQAQQYIDSALALGDDKYLTTLMEFDVAMELGNRYRARKALNSLADKTAFEYLIREAKYKDHVEGKQDEAIKLMEQAYLKIKDNSNPGMYLWTKSNLGDLYSHANRYREAYACYLSVLKKDPHYYHALKGIAWLAFSHDKDVANAGKIVAYLQQRHPVPDYELLLSQMAAFKQDLTAKHNHIEKFMTTTHNTLYGGMYNKYLFSIAANELNDATQSLQIARHEVQNRPTPEAFSWLAFAQYKNGQIHSAMKTARLYVLNKCFEPDALFYLGKIYQASGDKTMARQLLHDAYNSSFELGPVMSNRIREALNDLN